MNTPERFISFLENKAEEYKKGCEEIGVCIYNRVQEAQREGKIPTILIPSRGAIPIFLVAYMSLCELLQSSLPFNCPVKFYPSPIFESFGIYNTSDGNEKGPFVDVVIYPFTADVSLEPKKGEELARQIRFSAAKGVIDLLMGERNSLDLLWHFFLLSKFNPTDREVAESIKRIPPSQNRQVILVDTAISGRAVSDITSAFNQFGHRCYSIVAVDERKRLNSDLEREIRSASRECDLVKIPLSLTEDKGACFLGLTAVNFSNFNEEEFFLRINQKTFSSDFYPQSCVWSLPPPTLRARYLECFIKFLNGLLNPDNIDWSDFDEEVRLLSDSHREFPIEGFGELEELFPSAQIIRAIELSSHIISIQLNPKQAEEWGREFLRRLIKEEYFY